MGEHRHYKAPSGPVFEAERSGFEHPENTPPQARFDQALYAVSKERQSLRVCPKRAEPLISSGPALVRGLGLPAVRDQYSALENDNVLPRGR